MKMDEHGKIGKRGRAEERKKIEEKRKRWKLGSYEGRKLGKAGILEYLQPLYKRVYRIRSRFGGKNNPITNYWYNISYKTRYHPGNTNYPPGSVH
jgi:hypothetical protein